MVAFHGGLAESGYVDRQNSAVECRWADGQYDRLPAMAVELAQRRLSVLIAVGGYIAALVAKSATRSIPIVADFGVDPVVSGLVTSLERPGGNVTGISSWTPALEHNQFGLLRELIPQGATVGILLDTSNSQLANRLTEMRAAARAVGMQLDVLRASTEQEINAAFDWVVQHGLPAVAVTSDAFFDTRREQIVALAAHSAVPAIFSFREYAAAGGLMSYGIDLADVYRQIGIYAGQILNGAKVSDLPVAQPTKFELVINLKTAKALGFEVPPMLLARADELIE